MGFDDSQELPSGIIDFKSHKEARENEAKIAAERSKPTRRSLLKAIGGFFGFMADHKTAIGIAAAIGATTASTAVVVDMAYRKDPLSKESLREDFNIEPVDDFTQEELGKLRSVLQKLKPFEQLYHSDTKPTFVRLTDSEDIIPRELSKAIVDGSTPVELRRSLFNADDDKLATYELVKELSKHKMNQMNERDFGKFIEQIRGVLDQPMVNVFRQDLDRRLSRTEINSGTTRTFDRDFVLSELVRSRQAGQSDQLELAGVFMGLYSQGPGEFRGLLTQLYQPERVDKLHSYLTNSLQSNLLSPQQPRQPVSQP